VFTQVHDFVMCLLTLPVAEWFVEKCEMGKIWGSLHISWWRFKVIDVA